MKKLFLAVSALALGTSLSHAQTVLAGGEFWAAYDVFNFESDAPGKGTTEMINSGSNGGTWNLNSQSGRFTTDGSGFARTEGEAGVWARTIDYATPITSGKWRLVLDIGAYDFTTFDGMTGINDLTLELRDGTSSVAKLQFRIHDDVGSDGIADQTQLAISPTSTLGATAFSAKDSNIIATDNQVWDKLEIEFDFSTGEVYGLRDGVFVVGTGHPSKDTGLINFVQFDEVRLSTNGNWASTTADTVVLRTDEVGLYTAAIPEPSIFTMAVGLGAMTLAIVRRRS